MDDDKGKWGWVRYQRLWWRDADGRRFYIGHFRNGPTSGYYSTAEVRFRARRPILALKAICESGKHPTTFANAAVN